jgi:hypothetical protein
MAVCGEEAATGQRLARSLAEDCRPKRLTRPERSGSIRPMPEVLNLMQPNELAMTRPTPGIIYEQGAASVVPATTAARSEGARVAPVAPQLQEPIEESRKTPTGGSRRLVMPSNEIVARYLGVSLGGAVLGSLFAPAPTIGALLGALAGAGVVTFRLRHAAAH